jgi:hypothetical protein
LLTDWELWAVADATLKRHGDRAPIGALATEGDADGVAAWQAIARRMAALSSPPPERLNA